MFEQVIQLRPARLADAERIAFLSRDCVEVGLNWRWRPARVAWHIRCPDSMVVTACAGDRLVGAALMHFLLEEASLLLLVVEPPYRRSGTGRRLVEWLEKSARVAGIAAIHLEVRAGNRNARMFYRLLGYRESEVLPGYYYGLESAVRMVHDLRVTP